MLPKSGNPYIFAWLFAMASKFSWKLPSGFKLNSNAVCNTGSYTSVFIFLIAFFNGIPLREPSRSADEIMCSVEAFKCGNLFRSTGLASSDTNRSTKFGYIIAKAMAVFAPSE